MSRLQATTPIIAIVYGDGARIAPTLDRIATHLAAEGCRLAGLVQRVIERVGRSRCDMILEDLATGETVAISQDRGEGARGCRLDMDALLNAVVRTRNALATQPDIVIVNKFGKTECEGGGCRSLITESVEHNVPVLVAVPWANLESWRRFAGGLATEFSLDDMFPYFSECSSLLRRRPIGTREHKRPRGAQHSRLHEEEYAGKAYCRAQ